MMPLSDEQLMVYNQQGLIAGPNETEELFIKRIAVLKQLRSDPDSSLKKMDYAKALNYKNKIKKPLWSWSRTHLRQLFDVAPTYFLGFYQNKHLAFFEGAATWVVSVGKENLQIPLLQVKKAFKKGSYLGFYHLDEILSHESVHAIRAGFNEPKYEEFLAYMTSSSIFRRVLGPMVQSSKEIFVFLGLMFSSIFFQALNLLFYEPLFSILSFIGAISASTWLLLGFIRLFKKRFSFFRAYKKIFHLFKKKTTTLAVLFRLKDDEIDRFAKSSQDEINKYFEKNYLSSTRLKQIYLTYFVNKK